jgi:hypothetical protein
MSLDPSAKHMIYFCESFYLLVYVITVSISLFNSRAIGIL